MVAFAKEVGKKRYRESYGRYLEDFEIGDVYEHRPGRTITESDNTWFTLLTMNQHPLHSDRAYAAATQFGQNIVAGPYVYSLVFGMTVSVVSGKAIANLATTDMKHTGPVHHGDTLYARTQVLELRESKSQLDRGIVTVKTWGVNQDGEEILEFQRAVLVPKRDGLARE